MDTVMDEKTIRCESDRNKEEAAGGALTGSRPLSCVLGVTGGVGAGKSTVLSVLHEGYGIPCLRTDDIAKAMYQPGTVVYDGIVRILGRDIVQADGALDKKRMAAVLYADAEKQRAVNALVHPAVWAQVRKEIGAAVHVGHTVETPDDGNAAEQISAENQMLSGKSQSACMHQNQNGEPRIICVETALPDADFVDICDEIWFVYTEPEKRIERLMADRHYSREKAEAIIAAQPADALYERIASAVIATEEDKRRTAAHVRDMFEALVRRCKNMQNA